MALPLRHSAGPAVPALPTRLRACSAVDSRLGATRLTWDLESPVLPSAFPRRGPGRGEGAGRVPHPQVRMRPTGTGLAEPRGRGVGVSRGPRGEAEGWGKWDPRRWGCPRCLGQRRPTDGPWEAANSLPPPDLCPLVVAAPGASPQRPLVATSVSPHTY